MAAKLGASLRDFAAKANGGTPPSAGLGFSPSPLAAAAIVGLLVLAASLLGILSRPMGHLASFWPSNALLLGLMLRDRRFTAPLCWLAALAGFVAADLLTGSTLKTSLLLTLGNFTGILAGLATGLFISEQNRMLRAPYSVLFLLLIAGIASLFSGMFGSVIATVLFERSALSGFLYWFVTELVTYIAILPVMLTLPSLPWHIAGYFTERRRHAQHSLRLGRLLPALTLLLSALSANLIGGPGALAVTVPALLWCALTYPRFAAMLLTLLCSAWLLVAVALGYLNLGADVESMPAQMSVRLGIMLITLGPITAASAMAARNDLLQRLQHVADHDGLTSALNRNAFRRQVDGILQEQTAAGLPVALLMLDLDHFKQVNDTHGHHAGDSVLVAFAQLVSRHLRASDCFGRLGGEEFAVLLPNCKPADAQAIAERIRRSFADTILPLADGSSVSATVSIGVAHAEPAQGNLDALLQTADRALYRAKNGGRNRVELA